MQPAGVSKEHKIGPAWLCSGLASCACRPTAARVLASGPAADRRAAGERLLSVATALE